MLRYGEKIVFVHVKAHTKGLDQESQNNAKVDQLAKNGALMSKKYYQ